MIIGIPLPTEKDIPDAYTDLSLNCDYRTYTDNAQSPVRDLMQICSQEDATTIKAQNTQ